METALLKGRWSSSKVAKIYLADDGLFFFTRASFFVKVSGNAAKRVR